MTHGSLVSINVVAYPITHRLTIIHRKKIQSSKELLYVQRWDGVLCKKLSKVRSEHVEEIVKSKAAFFFQ